VLKLVKVTVKGPVAGRFVGGKGGHGRSDDDVNWSSPAWLVKTPLSTVNVTVLVPFPAYTFVGFASVGSLAVAKAPIVIDHPGTRGGEDRSQRGGAERGCWQQSRHTDQH